MNTQLTFGRVYLTRLTLAETRLSVNTAPPAPLPLTLLNIGVPGAAGSPGRDGLDGARGADGGAVMSYVATAALGGHRVLMLNAANELAYATNESPADAGRIVGLSLNAAGPGGAISVQRSGEVDEPGWSWDLDKPVWLGIDGLLTQSVPAPPAAFSLIVGFPATPTRLFLSIREPISLS